MSKPELEADLIGALQGIIASWDNNISKREEFVMSVSYGDYWSPHAAMVESREIAFAREVMERALSQRIKEESDG